MRVLAMMAGFCAATLAHGQGAIERLIEETFDTQPSYTALPVGVDPMIARSPSSTDDTVDDPGGAVDMTRIPLRDGGEVRVLQAGYGIVRNSAATTSPTYAGPLAGPDPAVVRGGMLHFQRASLGAGPVEGGLTCRYTCEHPTVVAEDGEALFVTMDFYKGSHSQFISFGSGILGNHQIVTHHLGGDFTGESFESLGDAFGEPGINEGLIMSFRFFFDPSAPDFCVSQRAIPEHGWFTLGLLMTTDQRRSVWVRDRESVLNCVTPMRTTGAYAGMRMFEEFGFGLEEGWAQLFPGTDDDPSTPGVLEGFGPAHSQTVPTPEVARDIDDNGNMTSFPGWWWSPGLRAWRLCGGLDQPGIPEYVMEDWWADNYVVSRRVIDPPPAPVADATRDGVVDRDDLAALLTAWGEPGRADLDLDHDGVVGGGDLTVMLAAWGR